MMQQLAKQIKNWGQELGFQQVGITDTDLHAYGPRFLSWLKKQYQGEMHYMTAHGMKRSQPEALLPGTLRIISVRMDYLPANTDCISNLQNNQQAYISRYALGADYHKLLRKRLQKLADKIKTTAQTLNYRAFCDSAPILEKPIAEKAGLGWIGKHTNLINAKAGSWFFLGELFTNLPLPIDQPQLKSHCGSCHACMSICPTQAIIAPYQLDARRCISYLTIELKGSIPFELRPLIGNRIYGCDDCQLVCPWNKFAKASQEIAFYPRHQLHQVTLLELFAWDESTFLQKTLGSAIRRIGYQQFLRNIAVALGNATSHPDIVYALEKRLTHQSELVAEHVHWALKQHQASAGRLKKWVR